MMYTRTKKNTIYIIHNIYGKRGIVVHRDRDQATEFYKPEWFIYYYFFLIFFFTFFFQIKNSQGHCLYATTAADVTTSIRTPNAIYFTYRYHLYTVYIRCTNIPCTYTTPYTVHIRCMMRSIVLFGKKKKHSTVKIVCTTRVNYKTYLIGNIDYDRPQIVC